MNGRLARARATAGLVFILGVSGCGVNSLRCGTDGDSSFVELVNLPQDISSASRYYGELCGFAYDGPED